MIKKIKTRAKSMSGFKKFVAIALVLALLTSITAFANENTGYNVEIYDGETKITVYTNGTSAAEVIKESGLNVTALDEVDISSFKVGEDSKIFIKRSTFVGISDAHGTVYFTFDGTVAQAIASANITVGENDIISRNAAEKVSDGMIISVARAFPVDVKAYGKTISLEMAAGTVADALEKAGVTLGENDVVSHDLTETVSSGMVIFVDEVVYSEKTVTEEIPFKETTKKSDSYAIGTTKITTKGVPGEKEITYKQKFVNGVLIDSVAVEEKVVKKPVNQVKTIGTKKVTVKAKGEPISTIGTVELDANGIPVNYTRIVSGSSTAYYGGGTTASGRPAKVGYVAVDPNVIPYGTKLYIVATDGTVYGYAIAADTGGFVHNGTNTVVDVYLDTYDECIQWGRRNVNIYVLG